MSDRTLAFVVGEIESGASCIDRALQRNPNSTWDWLFSAWSRVWLGDHVTGLDHVALAMRLSPADPHMFSMRSATAVAHFFAGRDQEALTEAETAPGKAPGS